MHFASFFLCHFPKTSVSALSWQVLVVKSDAQDKNRLSRLILELLLSILEASRRIESAPHVLRVANEI